MPGRTDFQHIYPRDMQVMTPQTFNHVMDMARMHRQNGGKVGMPSFEGNTGRDITIMRVLNKTDYDLNAGSILGIDGPVFTYEDNPDEFCYDPSFKGVVPALSDHIDKFCILIESAQKQGGAMAFLADSAVCGVVPVAVKMVSKWHTYARIDEGQTFALVSDVGGYPILWMSDTDATPPKDADGNPNYQGDDKNATYRLCLVAIGGNARNIAPWKNTGTDSVGMHGLFRSTGVNTSTKDYQAIEGEQPSDTVGKSYFVNGSTEVEKDGWGVYQTGNEVAVMVGDTSAPSEGDMLGPKSGHWGAYKSGSPAFLQTLGTIDGTAGNIIVLASKSPSTAIKILHLTQDYIPGTSSSETLYGYFDDDDDQTEQALKLAFRTNGVGRMPGTVIDGSVCFVQDYGTDNAGNSTYAVVGGQFSDIMEAVAYDTPDTGSMGYVSLWWQSPSIANTLVDSGAKVNVLNTLDSAWTQGQKLQVKWSPGDDLWVTMRGGTGDSLKRIVLTADYVPTLGSTMTGYFADDTTQASQTFYTFGNGPGIGRGGGGSSLTEGTWAWASYIYSNTASEWRWQVVCGEFETTAIGKVYDAMDVDEGKYVEIYWRNANGTDSVNSNQKVTAWNRTGAKLTKDDKVILTWLPSEGQWTVMTKAGSVTRRYKGTTRSAVTKSTTTFIVDSVTPTDGGEAPTASANSWIINNDCKFCIDANVVVRFESDSSVAVPSGVPSDQKTAMSCCNAQCSTGVCS